MANKTAARPTDELAEPTGGQCNRTTTIEAYKHALLPDQLFVLANPAKIDAYYDAVVRVLARSAD